MSIHRHILNPADLDPDWQIPVTHDHDSDGPHEHEDHLAVFGWGGETDEPVTDNPQSPAEAIVQSLGFERVS